MIDNLEKNEAKINLIVSIFSPPETCPHTWETDNLKQKINSLDFYFPIARFW